MCDEKPKSPYDTGWPPISWDDAGASGGEQLAVAHHLLRRNSMPCANNNNSMCKKEKKKTGRSLVTHRALSISPILSPEDNNSVLHQ